jgi:hypothetical protein
LLLGESRDWGLGRYCSSWFTLFGRLAPPVPAATTSSLLSLLATNFRCCSSHWWAIPLRIPSRFPCQQPHVPVWECGVRGSQRLRQFLPNCSTTASSSHGLGSGRFQTLIPSLLSSFAATRAHPAPCKRATTSFTRLDSSHPPDRSHSDRFTVSVQPAPLWSLCFRRVRARSWDRAIPRCCHDK